MGLFVVVSCYRIDFPYFFVPLRLVRACVCVRVANIVVKKISKQDNYQ